MSRSQSRARTQRSSQNSRIWSAWYSEPRSEDWLYVSSVRAPGQELPSQPAAWIWLDPCATSGQPPAAAFHRASILFQAPSASVPPRPAVSGRPGPRTGARPAGVQRDPGRPQPRHGVRERTPDARGRPVDRPRRTYGVGGRERHQPQVRGRGRGRQPAPEPVEEQRSTAAGVGRTVPASRHAAKTSTTEPLPAVAVPPGRAEQAFAASAAARSPAGARFANCSRSGSATVSRPFAATGALRSARRQERLEVIQVNRVAAVQTCH